MDTTKKGASMTVRHLIYRTLEGEIVYNEKKNLVFFPAYIAVTQKIRQMSHPHPQQVQAEQLKTQDAAELFSSTSQIGTETPNSSKWSPFLDLQTVA